MFDNNTRLFAELFGRITGGRKLFGRRQGVSRIWNFSVPYIFVSKPEWVEVSVGVLAACKRCCVI